MIYILKVLFAFLFIYLNINYLNILQQNHYKIKLMKFHIVRYYRKYLIWLISFLLFNILAYFNVINIILTEVFSFCILMYFVINYKKKIIKLKFTKRIIRIITILLIIDFLLIITGKVVFDKSSLIIANYMLIIFPLTNVLGIKVNVPIEKMINKKYIKNAKRIIDDNPNLIKIAVTGSYGKTSTKNILYQLLKDQYLTVCTPKSYNTLLGVTKTINSSVDQTTQIFIVECGATSRGDIKEIASLVKPTIGVITNIGPQHLETFKTIENIVDTKFELIDTLSYEGTAVINGDNEYINKREINNVKNIIRISLNNSDASYYAKITSLNPLEFIIYKNKKQESELKTNLLGKHNVQNILFCYAIIDSLRRYNIKISKEKIIETIKNLDPAPHRLEYKKINNIHLYDDSYNSNVVGFKNACEVLKELPYRKIIITPGIVELGKEENKIAVDLAETIRNTFDEIYIIENKASLNLINNLNNTNIFIYSSFKEAYKDCIDKNQDDEIAILIENDLPDNYLER